jgi:hypothetical protein
MEAIEFQWLNERSVDLTPGKYDNLENSRGI